MFARWNAVHSAFDLRILQFAVVNCIIRVTSIHQYALPPYISTRYLHTSVRVTSMHQYTNGLTRIINVRLCCLPWPPIARLLPASCPPLFRLCPPLARFLPAGKRRRRKPSLPWRQTSIKLRIIRNLLSAAALAVAGPISWNNDQKRCLIRLEEYYTTPWWYRRRR